ncbi:hypothetical protein QJQ45_002673 [Haematococcus lacustris]|nr:hypothetical protein QJQ45_002673 [Haematococcus lacustris]
MERYAQAPALTWTHFSVRQPCAPNAPRLSRRPSPPSLPRAKGKGKSRAAQPTPPAPQPGGWVDRDCNAALNMHMRIGKSKWRPLELCCWPGMPGMPAKGKEYPELGYKRL